MWTILGGVVLMGCGVEPPPPSFPLPDRVLTPGDALGATKEDVCRPGYAKGIREVPAAVKAQVYAEYGRRRETGICCEVDHLIPLELGGSNRIVNLWPQPYVGEWNARRKDRLEARLHHLVCSGAIDLGTAQRAVANNWIAAYQHYVADSIPSGSQVRSPN
jgi:hypothetical protein